MLLISILVASACTLLLYLAISKLFGFGRNASQPSLPPGPYGIPILGYLPFLGKQPHHVLTKLGAKYGSIFSISMGRYQGVVLHDWKAIKAAFIEQADTFSGRPILDIINDIGGRYGIIGTDGQKWKEQRRFSISRLRDLGFGKAHMETVIQVELEELCARLDKDGENGIDMKSTLFIPLLNVIWGLIAGKRFNYEDESLKYFKDLISEFIILSGIQDFLFLPTIFIRMGLKRSLRVRRKEVTLELLSAMGKEIENHRASLSEQEEDNSFMDSYLHEMIKHQGIQDTSFSDTQLKSIAMNFFLAGVETTATTLGWGCLFMSLWPEVQEKMCKELDAILGETCAPALSDRPRLPYSNAVIMEVQRMASIVPLSIAHRSMKSTTLLGYHIPKDCVIMPNLWHVARDPELWGDPENFRPERFLNEEGNVVKPEYFIPFSAGSRICLGESLAKMELFIFFTNMVRRFRIKLPAGAKQPDWTVKFGITLSPPEMKLILEKRRK